MVTVARRKSPTTRSGLPSPLTSGHALGCSTASRWRRSVRCRRCRRRAEQHAHGVVGVGDDEVGLAVAVEVARRRGGGVEANSAEGKSGCGVRRRCFRTPPPHLDPRDDVGLAVPVEVPHRHREGRHDGEGLLGRRRWARSPPSPSCSAAPTRCWRPLVGDDEVGLAVAVDVADGHGRGCDAGRRRSDCAAKEACRAPGAVVFSSTDTVPSP